jgi:hypothetical protein
MQCKTTTINCDYGSPRVAISLLFAPANTINFFHVAWKETMRDVRTTYRLFSLHISQRSTKANMTSPHMYRLHFPSFDRIRRSRGNDKASTFFGDCSKMSRFPPEIAQSNCFTIIAPLIQLLYAKR